MLKIRFDHLLGHLACRGTEIAPRPEMAPPVTSFQGRKLFEQLTGGLPFDAPHNLARGPRWRCRDQARGTDNPSLTPDAFQGGDNAVNHEVVGIGVSLLRIKANRILKVGGVKVCQTICPF